MAKIIIEKDNVLLSESAIVIEAPKYAQQEELEKKLKGPSKEEIEQKRESIKKKFEDYKAEAEKIFEEWKDEKFSINQNAAFDVVRKAIEEYDTKVAEANIKYSKKIEEALIEAEKIKNNALEQVNNIQEEASRKGYNTGKKEGFEGGNQWAKNAMKKLNIILSVLARERNELVLEAKIQIIEIVIVMARRIVKVLVETHPRVVYDNIINVLKHLKGRAEIIIRVNSEDLAQTTKHKREFLQMIEGIEKIKIAEDNSVDKGGCIIDTEYGSVDSRIITQMSKIEHLIRKILKHNPIE